MRTAVIALLLTQFVLAHSASQDGSVTLSFDPEPPIAQEEYLIKISVLNESALQVDHERMLHVLIAGEDLATFAHIHPEDFEGGLDELGNGEFFVRYTFPSAGKYVVVVDYAQEDEKKSAQINIDVIGEGRMERNVDFSKTKQVGAYTISSDKNRAKAGEPTPITFTLEKEGAPVDNLQKYLGSEVHAFIVDEALSTANHAHAYSAMEHGHSTSMQHYTGPQVPLQYNFTRPGVHAVFAQFQHEGEVITVNFHVKVSEPWTWLHYSALGIGIFLLLSIFMAFRSRVR